MPRRTAVSLLLIAGLLPVQACAQGTRIGALPIVHVAAADSTILQDIRYFGSDNFVGRPIDGYEVPSCMLSPEAAQALSEAQQLAEADGYALLVYDCYRPQRAVNDFVLWGRELADTTMKAVFYPDVPKAELFARGYIASRSGHSRASTVDLTLAQHGEPVDMGTPYDYFDERSHTAHPSIAASAMENRMRLKAIMDAAGFRNYSKEWWHYTLRDEPYPETYFNRPVR